MEQYGIRLHQEYDSISLIEFNQLLTGIGEKTALGKVVSIRAEKDSNVLKNMSKNEKRIRSDWQNFLYSRSTKEEKENNLKKASQLLKSFFG